MQNERCRLGVGTRGGCPTVQQSNHPTVQQSSPPSVQQSNCPTVQPSNRQTVKPTRTRGTNHEQPLPARRIGGPPRGRHAHSRRRRREPPRWLPRGRMALLEGCAVHVRHGLCLHEQAPRQNDGDDALRRQLRHRRNRRQSGRMLHCGIQCLRQQGALPLFEVDGHHDVLLPVRPQPLG